MRAVDAKSKEGNEENVETQGLKAPNFKLQAPEKLQIPKSS
jgi:hypothetical protein